MKFKSALNKYHVFDARKIDELLPSENVVDVTITSPPYWNLKDYGTEDQIGYGQAYDEYLSDLDLIFKKIYRMTKQKGSLWIISDTLKVDGKLLLLPFDLAGRLSNTGWILQDIVIWNKDRTLPWSHQGKLRNIFEYITFFSKSRKFTYHLDRVRDIESIQHWWVRYPERYSPKGKAPARTWDFPIPRQGSWGNGTIRHFNPLPPKLIERILDLTTNKGSIVLDPFAGSGTVLGQSHTMGRQYIGLDLNQDYKLMFDSQVLPGMVAQHDFAEDEARKSIMRKRKFHRLIRSLRKVKYAKEFIRIYRRNVGDIDVKQIFAIRDSSSGRFDIAFVFQNRSKIPQDFEANAKAISEKPPLSKFGIKPVFSVLAFRELSETWLKSSGLDIDCKLYSYVNGRTYAWSERIPLRKAMDPATRELNGATVANMKYPPILSNINVRVNPQSPIESLGGGDP